MIERYFKALKLCQKLMVIVRQLMKQNKAVMDYFVYPVLLAIAKFSYFSTHGSVETYAIFRVELVHALFLGAGRLIEHCLDDMLSDSTQTSTALKTNTRV